MQDINSHVVLNSKFGVGLEVVDLKQRTKRASLLKKTIRQEENWIHLEKNSEFSMLPIQGQKRN